MNEYNTIEKMKQMRMGAMPEIYHKRLTENLYRDHSADELLTLLVDSERAKWEGRAVETLIREAGFMQAAACTGIDYPASRNLERAVFEGLLGRGFIRSRATIFLTGATGCGKSHLAQCLGVR